MEYRELIDILFEARCAQDIDQYRTEIEGLIPQINIMFEYNQCTRAIDMIYGFIDSINESMKVFL